MDVIHGYETIFPIPSASPARGIWQPSSSLPASPPSEASADGISWTFSPMVDISRDPRWGRVSEGSGEDPFLGGAIARAMVLGYRERPERPTETERRNHGMRQALRTVRCRRSRTRLQHGRHEPQPHVQRIHVPYEAAVHAGVGGVMASFNEVDGVPATANRWLMTDVLRKQWGFNGLW